MTRRVYESYAIDDLRNRPHERLATLFNARTSVNESIAVYRNTMGDMFELRFDDNSVHVWASAGGVSIANIEFTPETPVEDTLMRIEFESRTWSLGFVKCADCRTPLKRFLSPEWAAKLREAGERVEAVVLSFHGGRYCRDCAPKYEKLARTEVD